MKPKAYLGIKYYPDNRNREEIEALSAIIEKTGLNVSVVVRDIEAWGDVKLTPQELMRTSFALLKESSVCILECSIKGVGLGIEAGYAHARGIPVLILAKRGTEVSTTLKGLASAIIYYEGTSDLEAKLGPNILNLSIKNLI